LKDAKLGVEVQAIAGLGLHGGNPLAQHGTEPLGAKVEKFV
jgi:hypothetical protein